MLKFFYVIAILFIVYIICMSFNFIPKELYFLEVSSDKIPLLGAFGIVISAFIASFSVKESIKSNKELKDNDKIDKRYIELKYTKSIVKKIELELKRLEENHFNYSDTSFLQLQKMIISYTLKIDSKELFFHLDNYQIDILLNIIARLNSISNCVDYYEKDKDKKKLYQEVNYQLNSHEILPLYSAIEKFLNSINID